MSEYVGLVKGKVHDKREMSEYYCGGCGYPVTDHDSYCRECGGALHEGMGKSRHAELFGTPERAAQLISDNCEYLGYCGQCWVRDANCDGKYSTVLEWLRGDAE